MIDRKRLLADLRKLVVSLETDLEERRATHPETDAYLRAEYERARVARRTAHAYEEWRRKPLTQSAIAWVLSCVFIRFLEDNSLLDDLAGPRRFLWGTTAELRTLAEEHYTSHARRHPSHTDREFLLSLFEEVGRLPGARDLFDSRRNPAFTLGLTADGAKALREAWQTRNPSNGELVFDFADAACDTRFLGDLYQELSESVRKRYALLQTPHFVESFILDRTLTPAIEAFGHESVRMIDPACGSGHFLLGAFQRLVDVGRRVNPSLPEAMIAQNALNAVHGVDINPYAVAIARFRLLIAALHSAGLTRLRNAPGFVVNVVTGDSLLHGPRPHQQQPARQPYLVGVDPIGHLYETEDEGALRRILGQRYHVVVANPPYITVKDEALSELYRARFKTCHRQYHLVCPFLERLFDLACASEEASSTAGFVGAIVSAGFTKSAFGTKTVEFLGGTDLTHVLDTSGIYVPGHGTDTVILLARARKPLAPTVRAVMRIQREPSTPADPAKGLAWLELCSLVEGAEANGNYVSVRDVARERFEKHPWSLGGGGLAELRTFMEEQAEATLGSVIDPPIGRAERIAQEELFLHEGGLPTRWGVNRLEFKPVVFGEIVRDWDSRSETIAWYPYLDLTDRSTMIRRLWPWRSLLASRATFSGTVASVGLRWYEYQQHTSTAYDSDLSITFAFVATHNHFAIDRGGRIFNRTAPVIKLPAAAGEKDYLGILGLLNSSTACFWLKQVSLPKGGSGIGRGIQDEEWEERYTFNGAVIEQFPLPRARPAELAEALASLAQDLCARLPGSTISAAVPTIQKLYRDRLEGTSIKRRMISLQEELDWLVYALYGFLDEELTFPIGEVPEVELGERAFEIVLARRMSTGQTKSEWFERHGSKRVTDVPRRWPVAYRALVARRIEMIETNPRIALVERPEYKRRWSMRPWVEQEQRALRAWLADRLESAASWPEAAIQTAVRLCDRIRHDAEFRGVAEIYVGRPDVDLEALVAELAEEYAVPYLAAYRYTEDGLETYGQWLATWELQRREDEIDERSKLSRTDPLYLSALDAGELKDREVGAVPVPQKYAKEEFRRATYWAARGKLDVPKERFIVYPGAERSADPSPVLGWAGWDHLQRAQALAQFYVEMRTNEGWPKERLVPLLAGLLELVPWLKQWHNEHDAVIGSGAGTYYAGFVESEARELGTTIEGLAAWRPEAKVARGRKRK